LDLKGRKTVLVGGPNGRVHLEDLGVDRRITLRRSLGRYGSMGWTGFGWFRIVSGGGLKWARSWTFGFHKESRLPFDELSDYQFFKEYPAPWNSDVSRLKVKWLNITPIGMAIS